jgi:hypothetical protein
MTSTQIWVAWKLPLNSPLFGAAIWECFVALFGGGTEHNQLFTFTLWPAVCAVGVLFILILEFSIRNMSHFLDDVHTVEVLNEPVDDSGSEGCISEMEYSPSESDSDSGI